MSVTSLPDISRAARRFHALSDETRLEIVRLLSHGERCAMRRSHGCPFI